MATIGQACTAEMLVLTGGRGWQRFDELTEFELVWLSSHGWKRVCALQSGDGLSTHDGAIAVVGYFTPWKAPTAPTEEMKFALIVAFATGFDTACGDLGASPQHVADDSELSAQIQTFIATGTWIK
jgi:hypothetical protein